MVAVRYTQNRDVLELSLGSLNVSVACQFCALRACEHNGAVNRRQQPSPHFVAGSAEYLLLLLHFTAEFCSFSKITHILLEILPALSGVATLSIAAVRYQKGTMYQ